MRRKPPPRGSAASTIPGVPDRSEPTGCRSAAAPTALLLGLAITFAVGGLALASRETCDGLCEKAALTLLYAGGPVSAAFGVLFGGVVAAWPLELTAWVVLGSLSARWAESRSRSPLAAALVVALIALAYGLVLAQLVEIVPSQTTRHHLL